MDFTDALKSLMEERDTSGAQLAHEMNVSQPAVSSWLKTGRISTDKLFAVARFFGVDAEALAEGKIVRTRTSHFCSIPVLNEVQAGLMTEINEIPEVEMLPVNTDYSECFALKIVGRSMEPDYHEGDYVIIDPAKMATSGNDVVAVIENENKATFKRYRERATPEGQMYFELYPLNDDFPTIVSLHRPINIKGVKVALFRPG